LAHAAKTFDHIGELFSGFGPVAVKRMFGGAGIYAGGTMFAIVIDGAIYLKADEHSIPAFEAEGLTPFTYEAKNKRAVMSYWRTRPSLRRSGRACAMVAAGAGGSAAGRSQQKPGQTSKIRNVKKGSKA